MTNQQILLIAGPEGHDDELVAAAVTHRPQRVTVLLDGSAPNWGLSDDGKARGCRDRLAALLTAVERASGATVVGLVGNPAELDLRGFDAVVDGRRVRAAA